MTNHNCQQQEPEPPSQAKSGTQCTQRWLPPHARVYLRLSRTQRLPIQSEPEGVHPCPTNGRTLLLPQRPTQKLLGHKSFLQDTSRLQVYALLVFTPFSSRGPHPTAAINAPSSSCACPHAPKSCACTLVSGRIHRRAACCEHCPHS